ncbi:antibiotic biosynthesis monooxygenase [uncultured Roseibium sp.]|uniref:putative quinol monooxygenase n=1 Tax=uncultured Roseibium sp. TaxID=1936171 RepID=UPI0026222D29|nr:antibiotic biosynthesis monooxygenase [uncultured Roseibium sp.]
MTTWVTLEMTVRDGAFEALSEFLKANLANVRGFDGALSVTLFYDTATRAFLIHEEWMSREHHQAYLAFIEEKGVMAALLGFMEGPPSVTYYQKLVM